ncbi:MAG: DUF6273 domain-containing protein [Clostridiales bacterium]|nr:DUF6273 domain-containing protein [Clostridiales bacterium]
MAQSIGNLPIGAKVKDTNTKFLGATIEWSIAAKNHAGYPNNSVTLLAEKGLRAQAYDAAEPTNPVSAYQTDGNAIYSLSNIHQWLNKNGSPWFVNQHTFDAPPNKTNPYDNIAGFPSNFSPQLRAALMPTTLNVYVAGSTLGNIIASVFLPSIIEVGVPISANQETGAQYPIFANDVSRLCYPTAQAVSANQHTSGPTSTSVAHQWMLRSIRGTASTYVISKNGTRDQYTGSQANQMFRPGINIPLTTLVSDTPDTNGYYTIVWNSAPTTPPSINVPTNLISGQSVLISWGESTDPDGDTPISYWLEYSINGGSFASLFNGMDTSYTHLIGAWSTVQYRVMAVDSFGNQSSWLASPVRTVSNNNPPTISGSDSDLGVKTAPFSQTFSVNDVNAGDTLTVTTQLNSMILQTIPNAIRNNVYSIDLTPIQFYSLASGEHTLKITVSDGAATATRTYTFTRNVQSIRFSISEDTGLNRAETVQIMLDTTASNVLIEARNNGADPAAVWETVTNGVAHTFVNTENAAMNWRLDVRVTVTPPIGQTVTVTGMSGIYTFEYTANIPTNTQYVTAYTNLTPSDGYSIEPDSAIELAVSNFGRESINAAAYSSRHAIFLYSWAIKCPPWLQIRSLSGYDTYTLGVLFGEFTQTELDNMESEADASQNWEHFTITFDGETVRLTGRNSLSFVLLGMHGGGNGIDAACYLYNPKTFTTPAEIDFMELVKIYVG